MNSSNSNHRIKIEHPPSMNSSNSNHRIKINAGGKHFETTLSTLHRTSLLSTTTTTTTAPLFIDADPHHITTLLSLSRNPPPPSPPPFLPFDASLSTILSPPLHPLTSAFSAASSTALLLAHGGLISRYHPSSLSLLSSTRTHLPLISSISAVSSTVSAVASDLFSSPPGLHFFGPTDHLATVLWSDASDPRTDKSRVTAVDSDDSSESTHLFACFDCRHRENAVLVIDKSTLRVVSEIGRQSGNTANSAALSKLKWVPSMNVLFGSSVTGGAFGYSGYIRMWDPRSGKTVWEMGGSGSSHRLGDTMADVDVDVDGAYIAKVGSRSGDVGVADMRRLGDDPWVYLEDPNPGLRGSGPVKESAVVHCWKEHVFVARNGALEAWSKVNDSGGGGEEGERRWGWYRRNYVDKEEDEKRGVIRKICGGGNRLFVSRENVEGVEVWESSRSSGLISVF